jgi:hypothetical protein
MLNDVSTRGKGKFLFFAIAGLIILMAGTWLLWWLVSPQLHRINDLLAGAVLTALRIFYLAILTGIILILLTSYTRRNFLVFSGMVRLSIRSFTPGAVAARCARLRDRMQLSASCEQAFVHS